VLGVVQVQVWNCCTLGRLQILVDMLAIAMCCGLITLSSSIDTHQLSDIHSGVQCRMSWYQCRYRGVHRPSAANFRSSITAACFRPLDYIHTCDSAIASADYLSALKQSNVSASLCDKQGTRAQYALSSKTIVGVATYNFVGLDSTHSGLYYRFKIEAVILVPISSRQRWPT
jgi:hypothetical protein